MGIQSKLSENGKSVDISIDGRFDFSLHREFRDAYESHGDAVVEYRIDMSETVYLDSSALGMMLLLRDFAAGNNASIAILNCNDDVRQIFAISNFEQLFDLD